MLRLIDRRFFVRYPGLKITEGCELVLKLNERIAQELVEWERCSGKKKAQVLGKSNLLDVDIRRQIIVGELVCRHFPDLLQCQPRGSEAENQVEFAPLESLLKIIAGERGQFALRKFIEYARRTD